MFFFALLLLFFPATIFSMESKKVAIQKFVTNNEKTVPKIIIARDKKKRVNSAQEKRIFPWRVVPHDKNGTFSILNAKDSEVTYKKK